MSDSNDTDYDLVVLGQNYYDLVASRLVCSGGAVELTGDELMVVRSVLSGYSNLKAWGEALGATGVDDISDQLHVLMDRLTREGAPLCTVSVRLNRAVLSGAFACLDWGGLEAEKHACSSCEPLFWRGCGESVKAECLVYQSDVDDLFTHVQLMRGLLREGVIRKVVLCTEFERVLFGDLVRESDSVIMLGEDWPSAARIWQFRSVEELNSINTLDELFFGLRHVAPKEFRNIGSRSSSAYALQEYRAIMNASFVIVGSRLQRIELADVYNLPLERIVLTDDPWGVIHSWSGET